MGQPWLIFVVVLVVDYYSYKLNTEGIKAPMPVFRLPFALLMPNDLLAHV